MAAYFTLIGAKCQNIFCAVRLYGRKAEAAQPAFGLRVKLEA
jgi:hypothetical protein